jgi:hypothetical protein
VTLRFPAATDREVIEAYMARIAGAFAQVETLTETEMQQLFWQQRQVSQTEHCVILRRAYTDPEYPKRFDAAFRKLNAGADAIMVH